MHLSAELKSRHPPRQGLPSEQSLLEGPVFAGGVLLAANDGGDSDSTGSIAGNLLGVIYGKAGIPKKWLEPLELRDVIERLGRDLWTHFGTDERGPCKDLGDYPCW